MPAASPRPSLARGPIRLFSMDHFTANDAAKRMATTPTQVAQRPPIRCSRSSRGDGAGPDGAGAGATASRVEVAAAVSAGARVGSGAEGGAETTGSGPVDIEGDGTSEGVGDTSGLGARGWDCCSRVQTR